MALVVGPSPPVAVLESVQYFDLVAVAVCTWSLKNLAANWNFVAFHSSLVANYYLAPVVSFANVSAYLVSN